MKKLPVFLVLLLVLTSLVTACSSNDRSKGVEPSTSTIRVVQSSDVDVNSDFSVLEDFVSAINDQFVDAALSLFSDEAQLSEIDQVSMMFNLHNNGWNHDYTGKDEIKNWLKDETMSNSQIVPQEYNVSGNYLIMDGLLYYQDQIMDLQLIEKTESGRISLLIYYIVKKEGS